MTSAKLWKNSALPVQKLHPDRTFLRLPHEEGVQKGSVAIFGAAHGTPYAHDPSEAVAEAGPDAVRRAITAASVHIDHWDFDFDGPLLDDGRLSVVDIGNVDTQHDDAEANRAAIKTVTDFICANEAIPILIGGDDSVAIPFMAGVSHHFERLHILQIDAHIDWRDDIAGEALGYSSTMRRASELPAVSSMTQIGIRAVGSARAEEVRIAKAWGSNIITASRLRETGIPAIVKSIPKDGALLIHIDCDAMDPSICPAVNAVSPGGLYFQEMTELIAGAIKGRRLAGFSIVEFRPQADINDISAIAIGRLISHVLGHLARR